MSDTAVESEFWSFVSRTRVKDQISGTRGRNQHISLLLQRSPSYLMSPNKNPES